MAMMMMMMDRGRHAAAAEARLHFGCQLDDISRLRSIIDTCIHDMLLLLHHRASS